MKTTFRSKASIFVFFLLFQSVFASQNLEEIQNISDIGNNDKSISDIDKNNDGNENRDYEQLRNEKYLEKISSGARIISVDDIVENVTEENLEKSKLKAIENGKEKALTYLLRIVDPDTSYTKQANNCIDSYEIKSEKFVENTYEANLVYNVDINKLKNRQYLRTSTQKNNQEQFNDFKKIGVNSRIVVVNIDKAKNGLNAFLDKAEYSGLDPVLYSISHNEIKLYETDELVKFLKESKFSFFIEEQND